MTSSNACQPGDNTSVEQGQTDKEVSAPRAPEPADLPSIETIRERLIQRAAEGEREVAMRLQVIRAVLHSIYGHGGAACHSMTRAMLKVLAEEARGAAGDGVVGAQELVGALDNAQKTANAAFSEWLTFCRQK
jgi:hypothetical protein